MTESKTTAPRSTVYPFAALVGQEQMKLALIANAINPGIGGVLIRGERGTAKSTAVRGLAAMLPRITVATCTFSCDPESENLCAECRARVDAARGIPTIVRQVRVVDLPVSATEDRVVGTIDLELALQEGRREFEAGLLADAHRGILYIDEVNLLDDHLVDTLLDSAASGTNRIEREGVAYQHPAEFILVGTMNPEEGDLRPQLLDRFGLAAEIEGDRAPTARIEIVRRRVSFESNSRAFLDDWENASKVLGQRIVEARELLPSVAMAGDLLALIAHIAITLQVDGHRADIVMYKTAITLAAWEGRDTASLEDIRRAAELALPHRRRRDPFTPPGLDGKELTDAIEAFEARRTESSRISSNDSQKDSPGTSDDTSPSDTHSEDAASTHAQASDRNFSSDEERPFPSLAAPERVVVQKPRGGRRTTTETKGRRGRSVRSRHMVKNETPDIALLDTVRAAALRSRSTDRVDIKPSDYRINRRTRKVGNMMLFVVDGSGSMAAQRRMALTKSAVLSLLSDAYKRRDRVGVITFRKTEAAETVPPTSSLDLAHARMQDLLTGGRTPLAHGLELARNVIRRERVRDPELRPILILLTDGVANVGLTSGSDPMQDALHSARSLAYDAIPALVVDADRRHDRASLLPNLARQMAATHVRLEALATGQLTRMIRLATA